MNSRLLSTTQENDFLQDIVGLSNNVLEGMQAYLHQEPTTASYGRRSMSGDIVAEEKLLLAHLNVDFRAEQDRNRRKLNGGTEDELYYVTAEELDGTDMAEKNFALAGLNGTPLLEVGPIIQTTITGDQIFSTDPRSTYSSTFEGNVHGAVSFVLGEPGVNCIQTCTKEKMFCDEFSFPKSDEWAKHMDLISKQGENRDIDAKGDWPGDLLTKNDVFYGTCHPDRWMPSWGTLTAPALYSIYGGYYNIEHWGYCMPHYNGLATDKRCAFTHSNFARFCPCIGGQV